MKRSELLKLLKRNGVVYLRSGGNHDIYYSYRTGNEIVVPRHSKELGTGITESILKKAGIKK